LDERHGGLTFGGLLNDPIWISGTGSRDVGLDPGDARRLRAATSGGSRSLLGNREERERH